MINAKTLKMIRRYARLRGAKDGRLNVDTLTITYLKANEKVKELFKKEMRDYFKAIDDKVIEPGDSILMSVVGKIELED